MSVWVFASQPNSLQIFRYTRYLQALNGRNSVIMNPNKSRMYPVRCVLAGQVGSLEPSLLVEKICSITLREQLTRSIIWRFGGCTKNYSKKKQHKNRGSRAIIGRKGAGEKSIRIHREIEREKTSHLSPKLFKWDSNQEGMKGDPKEGWFFFLMEDVCCETQCGPAISPVGYLSMQVLLPIRVPCLGVPCKVQTSRCGRRCDLWRHFSSLSSSLADPVMRKTLHSNLQRLSIASSGFVAMTVFWIYHLELLSPKKDKGLVVLLFFLPLQGLFCGL